MTAQRILYWIPYQEVHVSGAIPSFSVELTEEDYSDELRITVGGIAEHLRSIRTFELELKCLLRGDSEPDEARGTKAKRITATFDTESGHLQTFGLEKALNEWREIMLMQDAYVRCKLSIEKHVMAYIVIKVVPLPAEYQWLLIQEAMHIIKQLATAEGRQYTELQDDYADTMQELRLSLGLKD